MRIKYRGLCLIMYKNYICSYQSVKQTVQFRMKLNAYEDMRKHNWDKIKIGSHVFLTDFYIILSQLMLVICYTSNKKTSGMLLTNKNNRMICLINNKQDIICHGMKRNSIFGACKLLQFLYYKHEIIITFII